MSVRDKLIPSVSILSGALWVRKTFLGTVLVSFRSRRKSCAGSNKNLVENCLDMFAGIAENNDNHMKFHEQFGEHLKLASSLQLDSSIRRSASTA